MTNRFFSYIRKIALPGLTIGCLFGLLAAIVLHWTSEAPFRDRYLFLIGIGLYGLGGVVFLSVLRLLLYPVRRWIHWSGLPATIAMSFAFFLVLEIGVTGIARGWQIWRGHQDGSGQDRETERAPLPLPSQLADWEPADEPEDLIMLELD